jgi:membrane protease YdiL (CAAX protease family)
VTAELSARERGGNLLSFLPAQIREPRRPALALAVAWLLTYPASILLAALVSLLIPGVAQPQFNVSGHVALFLLVVFAPVIETLIMGGVLLVLLRLVSPGVAVLLSSLGWGIAHSLGAPTWGLVIWWPFLIFSTLFVTWRSRGLLPAFVMPAIAHGLHNLPSAILVAYTDLI